MAWIRRLPSGLWAATIYTRPGDPTSRQTETHELRGAVKAWADEQERAVKAGEWIDPKDGRATVAEWWERCQDSRALELASRKREASHWKVHVSPKWGRAQVGAILRTDVSAWKVEMQRKGISAETIEGALGVLRALLEQAVEAGLIRTNPARDVKAPRRGAKLYRVLTPDEDVALLAACDRLFPGRPDARLAVELALYCGLRWEEWAALDREHVDLRRGLLHIGPVMERNGTIRPYPKSRAGQREVPVDEDLWPRVREHTMTIPPGGLLITGPNGGRVDYSRWHDRVWSVLLAGRSARGTTRGHRSTQAIAGAGLADPQPTGHDLRRTYCTRLGEQGMAAHELMALSGHSTYAAVKPYLVASDGRHDRARNAIRRARLGS